MRSIAGGAAAIRLLAPLVVAVLLVSAIVAVVMASSHRTAVAAAETAEQANALRSERAWAAFEARVAQHSKVVARQTARDRVAAARAAREQKARRAVIQRAAALKEAARQQAAREKAAREQAARAAAAQAVADKRAAVKAEAARKVAADKAAIRRAARLRAAARAARLETAANKAARQRALAQAAASRVIAGGVTSPSVVGALVARVGDYPGQPWSQLRAAQRTQVRTMMTAVNRGRTYACPAGAGGRYRGIAVGTQVRIRDGRGDVVSVATLSGGRIDRNGCTFRFRASVPNAELYKVKVAESATADYTRRALVADRWRIAIRLT